MNARDHKMVSNEGKMEKSFLTFKVRCEPNGTPFYSRL